MWSIGPLIDRSINRLIDWLMIPPVCDRSIDWLIDWWSFQCVNDWLIDWLMMSSPCDRSIDWLIDWLTPLLCSHGFFCRKSQRYKRWRYSNAESTHRVWQICFVGSGPVEICVSWTSLTTLVPRKPKKRSPKYKMFFLVTFNALHLCFAICFRVPHWSVMFLGD